MALESLNAFWTLERWRREKTSKAIFSSSSDWHLISSFSLSCKRLWWEQETKVQPFAVKYCVNKTKRDCYSFFFCQCPASERVSRTVKWSCTVLFLFSYTPWIFPIDVKNNGSFYMPAGNHQIDFPWALYRFKKKKWKQSLREFAEKREDGYFCYSDDFCGSCFLTHVRRSPTDQHKDLSKVGHFE